MKCIDFLVIGAQKSGTTSLYQHLRAHPEIFLPKEKEVAFFALDERYERGLSWYLDEYFSEANNKHLCGEVSPQYMSCLYAAERIAKYFPEIRLIAILRNPIDRAYSAYRMQVRRGKERRTFSEVIRQFHGQKLTPIGINKFLGDDEYVRKGMYGTILGRYLELFPLTHIRIVFTEDLQANPELTMHGIYSFLKVNENYIPDTLSKKFHEGGCIRFSWLPSLLRVGRRIVSTFPLGIRRKLRGKAYWLMQWNIRPEEPEPLSDHERRLMVDLFLDEVQRLETLFCLKVPWSDFLSHDGNGKNV